MAKKTRAVKKTKTPPRAASTGPVAIVALGASAGAVQGLRQFLSHIDPETPVAYVITQHLDEHGNDLALEVLKSQSPLPVIRIESGTKLRSGHIFHAPAHSRVGVKNNSFVVENLTERNEAVTMIDFTFRSLAAEHGARVVGILLSGEGADGALGLKAISDAGGMTMTQNPESTGHPSMPENAIATGAIDHIARPEHMPGLIRDYVQSLKRILERDGAAVQTKISSALIEICEILLKKTRHDFKHYKTTTLVRRIQRRLQVLQLDNVESYLEHLQKDPKEADALFKELLINVTNFFRDPEAFETLKEEVLVKALKSRPADSKYRIWVAGCSTGEEVYTIAILVREVLSKLKAPCEVQIIATDIDEVALNQARKGVYPITIDEHVSRARLKRFFTRKTGKYHVNKEIREMVLFSSHNLINDPPFSQLDLISCRNVLIYLGPHLQKKLIPVFHYALRPGGSLFLGNSETLTNHKELFRPTSAKHRIAQRKATAIRPPGFSTTVGSSFTQHPIENVRNHEADIHQISQRILLDEFAPKYAVVNDECQIVSVSAGIAHYMEPSEGTFQNNLMKLVKPSLRVGLRTAFTQASKQKRKVSHYDSSLKHDKQFERIGITVQPMPQLGDEAPLFMVVFTNLGPLRSRDQVAKTPAISESDVLIIDQLERELGTMREDLDRSVQDLEASNEELKSSNEELLSMNEELQSANEELEASKEDVQIANEALSRSNSDLENLLASTDVATLFLDEKYNILSFTPQVESVYNLSKVDIGRPITDITDRAQAMPAFPAYHDILNGEDHFEDDIPMRDGRWLQRRLLPYRTSEGEASGIVATFVDITKVRAAEERYRELADTMPMIVWTANPDGYVDYFNRRWYEFAQLPPDSEPDGSWIELLHPEDAERTARAWSSAVKAGKPLEIEFRFMDRSTGAYRWFLARAVAVRDATGNVYKYYGTNFDIDDRVAAENRRREGELRFQVMADRAPVLIWLSGTDMQRHWFNRSWLNWTGRSLEVEQGSGWSKSIHPDDFRRFMDTYEQAFRDQQEFIIEYRLLHHSGEYRWVNGRGTPRFTADGRFEGFIGGCMDINELRLAREAISRSERMLDLIFQESPAFMSLIKGPNHVYANANKKYYEVTGMDSSIIGKTVKEVYRGIEPQGFVQLLDRVIETGEPYYGFERPLDIDLGEGRKRRLYLDFAFQPLSGDDGKIFAIVSQGFDVTDRVLARRAVEEARARQDMMLETSPSFMAVLSGPDYNFIQANERYLQLVGRERDIIGKTLREALPEIEGQGFIDILDHVRRTGEPYTGTEVPVMLKRSSLRPQELRYLDFAYQAVAVDGDVPQIFVHGVDVTEKVQARSVLELAKQTIEIERENFRNLFRQTPEMVVILNGPEHVFEFVNEAHTKALGFDATGMTIRAAQPESTEIHGILDNVYETGVTAELSEIPVTLGDRLRYFNLTYAARRDSEGKINGVMILGQEISDQITNRESVESQKQALELTLRGASTEEILHVLTQNLEQQIGRGCMASALIMADDGQHLQHGAAPSLPPEYSELVHGLPIGPQMGSCGTAAYFGKTVIVSDIQKDPLWAHGREIAARFKLRACWSMPILSSTRKVLGTFALYYHDVRNPSPWEHKLLELATRTAALVMERRQSMLDLQTAKDEAEEARATAEMANESKTRFLANMSHEIRTPLAAILGYADLLQGRTKESDSEAAQQLDRISKNASQLGRLIDDLLDLSKIEAERFEIDRADFDLLAVVNEVVDSLALKARDKDIAIRHRALNALPTVINTDPTRFRQVLTNVVGNAVKFTEHGRIDIELEARQQQGRDMLWIRVRDTGIGLSPEHQKRIFDRFVQGDASVTRKYGGTGLGLVLSRRLAQLMGGDFILEDSELGRGSSFLIMIALGPVGRVSTDRRAPVPKSHATTLSGRRILVVDDAPDNQAIIQLFIEAVGGEVAIAGNGREAVDAMLKETFDVVLMDIQMPVMDGYQALKTARESGYLGPILALTAHALKEEKDACLDAGFTDYLSKPIDRALLIHRIAELSTRPNEFVK
ncbi:MAG: PAS domain-containing protein [Bdellovibrionaceae bacterium]|nr:PAS domain-containing protein [Pseudobdellovibrionaceae bacterium]